MNTHQQKSELVSEVPPKTDLDRQVAFHRGATPGVRAEWFGFWDMLGVTIALAGGAYPLVLLMLVWIVGACVVAGRLFYGEVSALGEAAIGAGVSAVLALMFAGVCLLYTGMASVLVLPCTAGTLRLLGWRPKLPYLGAFCGGLIAFTCFLPFVIFTSSVWDNPQHPQFLWYYAAGPLLGILCGLAAGAHAGVESERELELRGTPTNANGLKFSIKQMLAITVVASLLLTAMRMAGLLNARMLAYVTFWLVWQSLAMYPVVWLMRLRRRHAERVLAAKIRRIDEYYGQRRAETLEPVEPSGAT